MPGHRSAHFESVSTNPMDDGRPLCNVESDTAGSAIVMQRAEEEDLSRGNQGISRTFCQEQGLHRHAGGGVISDHEPGQVDTNAAENEPSLGEQTADNTNTDVVGTQQDPPGGDDPDAEREGNQDHPPDLAHEQGHEQMLWRSPRKRSLPAADSGSAGVNDSETRPVRQAALRARQSCSGQSASHGPCKRRKHSKKTTHGAEDLPQLESRFGNDATLTAMREAKRNWTAMTQSELVVDDGEAAPSDGVSLMISLGRRFGTRPAQAWAGTVLRRIRYAHFHQLYMAALKDGQKGDKSSFFYLSDELLRRHDENPTRRHGPGIRVSTAVKDRLIKLILLDSREQFHFSENRCRETIQSVEQSGKYWSRLIQSMGYEVLLLVPTDFSDNK